MQILLRTLLFGCFWCFELQSCHSINEFLVEGHGEVRQAFAIRELSRLASSPSSRFSSLITLTFVITGTISELLLIFASRVGVARAASLIFL